MNKYRKTITALATAGLGWAAVVIASPAASITGPEWLAGGVALATAIGVYAVPNA